jgi:hypothetical protein
VGAHNLAFFPWFLRIFLIFSSKTGLRMLAKIETCAFHDLWNRRVPYFFLATRLALHVFGTPLLKKSFPSRHQKLSLCLKT